MSDLSPHFSSSEFRSRDRAPLPDREILLKLCSHLEVLRCLGGRKPITIVSGHRSQAHNAAVGGARNSRHLVGDAVDLTPGWCTVDMAVAAGFRGIGTKGRWVTHVDLRPTPARWVY